MPPTNGAINKEKIKILLLTNRDSDNLGDQVIEACDISLIEAAMENLNINHDKYEINSRAAAIISRKYMQTKDPKLLNTATKLIEGSDIIIFGGAPLFNYQYQNFYLRTIVTLKIAEKYHRPVIFSAIGIESYDENNKKCQRLKETLNFECVKQVTTRDDFEALQRYIYNEQIAIGKVSDPAVLAGKIFERHIVKGVKPSSRPKVGIFVIRPEAFHDNKIAFSKENSIQFWIDLIHQLEKKHYDYELLTSGHVQDEALLDCLIKKHGVKASKCAFNMNTPEKLIQKISSYDAVISCRLHPSIISFSLNVPSIGISWNPKVKHFYSCIGYSDRIINVLEEDYEEVVEKLNQVLNEGVKKDAKYLMSVYNSLFRALKKLISPNDNSVQPYNYTELLSKIPIYEGTSECEQEKKLERKFRRIYASYNDLKDKA